MTGIEVVIGKIVSLSIWHHIKNGASKIMRSRDIIGHVTIQLVVVDLYGWSIVTMHLSTTSSFMEIWPFEVLPGRLFQEQKLVVDQSSILH